jgi:hypothetical protein
MEEEMSRGSRVRIVILLTSVVWAGCSADSSEPDGSPAAGEAGTAGAACYPNGTCDADFECKAGTCIVSSTPDSDAGSTTLDEGSQVDSGGQADPGTSVDPGGEADPGSQSDSGGGADPGASTDLGNESDPGGESCEDQCTAGTIECAGAGYRTCGNTDDDECTEWDGITPCGDGKECEEGVCRETQTCTNQCAPDATECASADSTRDCVEGEDGCTVWSLATDCPTGKVCEIGVCVCKAEDEKRCDGDAVYWFDSCGQRGDKVTDCPHGCENASCKDCTPVCDDRICGPDGCGGVCGFCSNGICLDDFTCGCENHLDCMDDSVCVDSFCTLAYGRAYRITFVSAKIAEKNPNDNGESWDSGGGAPDAYVVYKFGDVEGQTPSKRDTFQPTWNHSFTTTLFTSQVIELNVWDEDTAFHDWIGGLNFEPPGDRISLEWIRGGGLSFVADSPTYGLQELVLVITPIGEDAGACTNAADGALLDSDEKFDGVVAEATTCGMTALTKPAAEQQQFALDCVKTETGLSEGCATCFAESTACTIEECVAQCAADPSPQGCIDCREDKGCTPDFFTCSGFTPSE